MDNDTHMLFHDWDVREVTLDAIGAIYKWVQDGVSQQEINDRLKQDYSFTPAQIDKVMSTLEFK